MISQLYIPDRFAKQYTLPDDGDRLTNINKINIFIGPNNSGKSRILRALFAEDLRYQTRDIDFKSLIPTAKAIHQAVGEAIRQSGHNLVSGFKINDVQAEISNIVELLPKATLPTNLELFNRLFDYINKLKHFEYNGGEKPSNRHNFFLDTTELVKSLRNIGSSHSHIIKKAIKEGPKYEKIYIPMLRGLRPIQYSKAQDSFKFETSHDNYKERTKKDYFAKNSLENREIFTGLSLYEETTNLLLGKLDDRRKVREFESFLSKTFFGGESVSLTPNRSDDCMYLTIENEDHPIHELGDGMQSLIILLYPLFFNREKDLLVFIEEPELSLHPGMQRLYIDSILRPEFSRHQFFLTTHSNHFLDMVLDHSQISIYNFKKISIEGKNYQITNTSNADINLLDSIGVRNSSVFLSNCTIWVEGVSDRLYINKYLEVYQRDEFGKQYEIKRFKEDLHYSFIEYGGANIVHFSFDDDESWEKIRASSISNRIMVVMDEDGTSQVPGSKKSQRITDLRSHLQENLLVLPCREIENTLSPKILTDVIRQLERNPDLDCSKISDDKYKDEYLGLYVEANIDGLKKKYAADSGTIKDKVKFCKIALEHIHTFDDLSTRAKEMTKTIYDFIKRNN